MQRLCSPEVMLCEVALTRITAYLHEMLIYLVTGATHHHLCLWVSWDRGFPKTVKGLPLFYMLKELMPAYSVKPQIVKGAISEGPSPASLLIASVKNLYSQHNVQNFSRPPSICLYPLHFPSQPKAPCFPFRLYSLASPLYATLWKEEFTTVAFTWASLVSTCYFHLSWLQVHGAQPKSYPRHQDTSQADLSWSSPHQIGNRI